MASESQGVSPLKRRRTSGAKVAPAAAEVESLREMEGLGKDAMISSLRLACLEVGPLRTPSIGGTKKAVLDVFVADAGGVALLTLWGELATKNKLPLERALNGCEDEKFVRIVMKKVEARGSPGEVRKLESTPQTSLEIEKTALPLLIKPELETIITDFSMLACKDKQQVHVKGVVTDLEPVRWARKSESNMQVFRLVDTAGRAVRIVAWGDSNVDHPAIQDRQEVVLFYTVARKSPERSDESDGGLWLFASYILGVGACEEVPALTELIAIT